MTYKNSNFSGLLYYNPVAHGFNPVTEATITPPTTINEGDSFQFAVTTWNIPDGTTLYYRLTNLVNLDASRFADISDSFVVTRNRGYILNGVTADNATATGTQTFDVVVSTTPSGPALATSLGVVVNDTSTPAPSASWGGIYYEPISEGTTQRIDINYSNWDGSTIYWTVYGGTATGADFNGGYIPSGNFTSITGNGVAIIEFIIAADSATEGSETYYVKVGTTLGGTEIANNGPYTISDTSVATNGLSVNWLGSTSEITPTGGFTPLGNGAVTLNSGSYINVGHNLPSNNIFSITIDADMSTGGGGFWNVLWGNDAYDGPAYGWMGYWTDAINFTFGRSPATTINLNGAISSRKIYTFVVSGLDVAMYLNGAVQYSGTLSGTAPTIPNNNLYIGARHDNGGGTTPYDARGGSYYSVRVRDTAMTATQVEAEYLVMPGAKTLVVRQWGNDGYGGGDSAQGLKFNVDDYPNALLIPAGATYTYSGNTATVQSMIDLGTQNGHTTKFFMGTWSTGPYPFIPTGAYITVTWTV